MTDINKIQFDLCSLYAGVFNTDSGKKVIEDLERVVKYYDSIVTDKINPNPNEILYKQGMRDVVSRIKNYSNSETLIKFQTLLKEQRSNKCQK